MKEIGGMKFYTLEEVTDEMIGKVGTPKRDEFDRKISDELAAIKVRRNANGQLYETDRRKEGEEGEGQNPKGEACRILL